MGETTTAPWPIAAECRYPAPRLIAEGHQCPQCDGSHVHIWLVWRTPDPEVLGVSTTGALPVRCKVCGGRKCDVRNCSLRRAHGEPHEPF